MAAKMRACSIEKLAHPALSLVVLLATAIAMPAVADHFVGLAGSPNLRSASALVLDGEGNVIFSKDADTVRPIASITKLATVMVILDAGLPLEEPITITREDRDLVQLTGSRLEYGAELSRREMILLAVMSSENRAAAALGRTWPYGPDAFVVEMNRLAERLEMDDTRFADPAGLRVENASTARDLGRLLQAAHAYPLIREASTTQRIEVRPYAKRGPLVFGNTNRLLKNPRWDIALSKTGYLNESGRCLVMQARMDGEDVFIILLNSFGKLTPFGDSNRLRTWMLKSG
jgi:D-alanyl-D-alanine endopeptidase (penicillin-binding protein 7)